MTWNRWKRSRKAHIFMPSLIESPSGSERFSHYVSLCGRAATASELRSCSGFEPDVMALIVCKVCDAWAQKGEQP